MRIEQAAWPQSSIPPTPERRSSQSRESGRGLDTIVGRSASLQRALSLARRVATTDLPILLVGATGTGKELFAQQVHRWSRPASPLVDVNCAALPRDMIEAELFGHRRGAFTGAAESTAGLLEAAHGGTLFLDEVLSMPLEAQPKLLRVLESGEVRRIGETIKRQARFRIIAAVQDDVAQRVAQGSFRADVLQRLAGLVIELPTLVERHDDILMLAEHFAASLGRALGPGAEGVLRGHSWPGNVRELRLSIERAACLCTDLVIPARVLSESVGLGAAFIGIAPDANRLDVLAGGSSRDRVLAVLAAHGWNAERSARALGLGRTTFFKQLRALGISLRRERSSLETRFSSGENR